MKRLYRRLTIQLAHAICCLACCLSLATGSGCQFAPKVRAFNWPWNNDETKPLPDRILAVWTDSVLHQPNQPGVRGFGGRVYFYAKGKTDPIEVDGSLAVYVFEADDVNVSSQKPLRKFVFTADQFNEHMSKTSIGPSYSVWLPWGEIGGPPRRLSLIARFEGRAGGTTISDPTIKLLPGVPIQPHSAQESVRHKTSSSSPFSVSGYQKWFDTRAGKDNEEEKETDNTCQDDIKTIDLPPSFQRHLRGSSIDASQTAAPEKGASNIDPSSSSRTDASVIAPPSSQLVQATTDGKNHEEQSVPPITTQVYDYRTRSRHGQSAFGPPKTDIRQGRWINSITRD